MYCYYKVRIHFCLHFGRLEIIVFCKFLQAFATNREHVISDARTFMHLIEMSKAIQNKNDINLKEVEPKIPLTNTQIVLKVDRKNRTNRHNTY